MLRINFVFFCIVYPGDENDSHKFETLSLLRAAVFFPPRLDIWTVYNLLTQSEVVVFLNDI